MRPLLTALTFAALTSLAPGLAMAQRGAPWGGDKLIHVIASCGVTSLGYAAASQALERPFARALVGGGLGLLAGAAKELLDLSGLGEADWRDLAWDTLGVAVGLLVALAIDTLSDRRRRSLSPAFD